MRKIIYMVVFFISIGLVSAYDIYEDVNMNGYSIYNLDDIYVNEGLYLHGDLEVNNLQVSEQCVFGGVTFYGGDLIPIGWGVINIGSIDNPLNGIYTSYTYRYDFGWNRFLTCYYYRGEEICR